VLGGVVGGVIGALVSRDKVKGALIGAAAGAALGGTSGYLEAKKRAAADRRALVGSVYEDMGRSNQEAARALAAFIEARTCRFDAAKEIRARLASGRIDRNKAEDLLEEHKKRLAKDIANAERFSKDYGDSLTQFRSAADLVSEPAKKDQSYLKQLDGIDEPPEPTTVSMAANLRGSASAKAKVVGKLTSGEEVEVVGEAKGGWTQVRREDGKTGFVSSRLIRGGGKPKVVRLSEVSQDLRTIAQPLTEGVEKRRAIDAEVKTARAQSNETFDL
jgi:hypothetical protein